MGPPTGAEAAALRRKSAAAAIAWCRRPLDVSVSPGNRRSRAALGIWVSRVRSGCGQWGAAQRRKEGAL